MYPAKTSAMFLSTFILGIVPDYTAFDVLFLPGIDCSRWHSQL